MLSIHQLTHGYESRTLFRDVSLQTGQSRLVITGPNGCGKTTFLMLAGGLLTPQSGSIKFNDKVVTSPETKPLIGVSASRVALPDFITAKALLQFQAEQFSVDQKYVYEWVNKFNFSGFLATKIADLSLGNYKKLSLIAAFAHQPELLLLDEPTNGLDEQGLEVLAEFIAQYSGQIVIASHDANSTMLTGMDELAITELTL